jgi:hypothetical protein
MLSFVLLLLPRASASAAPAPSGLAASLAVPNVVTITGPAQVLTDTIVVPTSLRSSRLAFVSGQTPCAPGSILDIKVALTQASATGQNRVVQTCTGHVQNWVIQVAARGRNGFQSGPARVCATTTTRSFPSVITEVQVPGRTTTSSVCNEVVLGH